MFSLVVLNNFRILVINNGLYSNGYNDSSIGSPTCTISDLVSINPFSKEHDYVLANLVNFTYIDTNSCFPYEVYIFEGDIFTMT